MAVRRPTLLLNIIIAGRRDCPTRQKFYRILLQPLKNLQNFWLAARHVGARKEAVTSLSPGETTPLAVGETTIARILLEVIKNPMQLLASSTVPTIIEVAYS